MKKEERKFALSKENATKEFDSIVSAFGFNISTDAKERIVKMTINSIDMETSQELSDADAMIQKIMEGRIKFDEEKTEIVYNLKKPVSTGENGEVSTNEIRFGEFTRAKQKGSGVPLNECNFGTLPDEKMEVLLMALTGISDPSLFNKLNVTSFNDLRMIGGYFFL